MYVLSFLNELGHSMATEHNLGNLYAKQGQRAKAMENVLSLLNELGHSMTQ